jgi:hypothetical protein
VTRKEQKERRRERRGEREREEGRRDRREREKPTNTNGRELSPNGYLHQQGFLTQFAYFTKPISMVFLPDFVFDSSRFVSQLF